MVVLQLVLRLAQPCLLCFVDLRRFHEWADNRNWIGPEIKPLAVHAFVSEPAVQLGLDVVTAFEDREQLQEYR